jgi:hypothetical protein
MTKQDTRDTKRTSKWFPSHATTMARKDNTKDKDDPEESEISMHHREAQIYMST